MTAKDTGNAANKAEAAKVPTPGQKSLAQVLAEKAAQNTALREEGLAPINEGQIAQSEIAQAAANAVPPTPVIIANSADPSGTTGTVNLPSAVQEQAGREYEANQQWSGGPTGNQATGSLGSVAPGERNGASLNAFVRAGYGQEQFFEPTEDELKGMAKGTFLAGTMKQYISPNGEVIKAVDGVFLPLDEDMEKDLRHIARRNMGELYEGTGK